jgi:hypothetical protein
VESIEEWQMRAVRMTRRDFEEEYEGFYLVKRPEIAPPSRQGEFDADPPIDFETVSAVPVTPLGQASDESFPWEWRVSKIQKREGNPFPDRISVGRAPNCDIAIRLPFISKLHAHFVPDEEGRSVTLVDLRPANGTSVNARQLSPGERVELGVRDRVHLGTLELELADAGRLYDLLLREARGR